MVERYKNGNIHIRFEPDEIEDINAGRYSEIELLFDRLFWVGTYEIGEPGCAGNYDMYITLYSYYSDKCYMILYSEIDKLKEGKTIILRAFEPDAETREMIA